MKHYGDIKQISGLTVPPVDVITGGSPCQDLSVAGKRAGLDGERSGLFMEQIRVIKEMRSKYVRIAGSNQLVRLPRFAIWENVPGAFSSNKGKDFQAVLSEFVRIAEPDAPDVPMPEGERWPKAGCLYDEMGNWSVAWRVHDAQFWGVPQRRKRIALVADFGGLSAPEILFERKGLSGNPESGAEARKRTAGAIGSGVASTITATYGTKWNGNAGAYSGGNFVIDQQAVMVAAVDCRNGVENGEINGTLQAQEQGQNLNSNNVCRCGSVVRRLTPLECERLQGYPDGWTDIGEWTDRKGKKHKPADSPRYKALGNSIALPFWQYLARRICAQYERPATMASLFDGIGGFPLVFQRCGAIPTWASEIDEFPMAVTKLRFLE